MHRDAVIICEVRDPLSNVHIYILAHHALSHVRAVDTGSYRSSNHQVRWVSHALCELLLLELTHTYR